MTAELLSKPRPRIPEWLRLKLPTANTFAKTRNLLNDLRLHTVCESARCPNHWECWSKGTATFMIAGDRCTRRSCGWGRGAFSSDDRGGPHGKPRNCHADRLDRLTKMLRAPIRKIEA